GAKNPAADWDAQAAELRERTNRFLWQPARGFYRTHLHLTSVQHAFDEDSMVSIANAVAVSTGLADSDQAARIFRSLEIARTAAAVSKPGLAIYPPYPWDVWGHPLMGQWDYQNGGQWDWWGAHQIFGEFAHGQSAMAMTHLAAVAKDWQTHPNNIYEWQNPFGKPYHGSSYYAAAGGTMGDAVVRGLFGIEMNLKGFTLGPRLGAREGSVDVTHPAAGYAVNLRQQVRGNTLTVSYNVRHPGGGEMTVLLPAGQTAANVLMDGKPWPFRVYRVGDDLLAELEDLNAGAHEVTIPLRALEKQAFGVNWDVEPARTVGLPASPAPVLAAVQNTGESAWRAGEPGVQLQARWLDANGGELPNGVTLVTAVPVPAALRPGEAAPLNTAVKTPSAPGEYTLRWEALGPDGALLPGAVREAPFRVAVRPWNAIWLGGVAEGSIGAGKGKVEIGVAVENAGTEWWSAAGPNPVLLTPRWTHDDGSPAPEVTPSTTPLPADVAPGASVRLIALVTPPAEPGRYRLIWDLQQQSGRGFAQSGSATMTTIMTVVPAT
ncbi:MAG: hypothetical protein NTZ05_12785, partial [Chloroflexi bacterium]|nr:hypothetical protein [Chloroflexota bacterium]